MPISWFFLHHFSLQPSAFESTRAPQKRASWTTTNSIFHGYGQSLQLWSSISTSRTSSCWSSTTKCQPHGSSNLQFKFFAFPLYTNVHFWGFACSLRKQTWCFVQLVPTIFTAQQPLQTPQAFLNCMPTTITVRLILSITDWKVSKDVPRRKYLTVITILLWWPRPTPLCQGGWLHTIAVVKIYSKSFLLLQCLTGFHCV